MRATINCRMSCLCAISVLKIQTHTLCQPRATNKINKCNPSTPTDIWRKPPVVKATFRHLAAKISHTELFLKSLQGGASSSSIALLCIYFTPGSLFLGVVSLLKKVVCFYWHTTFYAILPLVNILKIVCQPILE